MEFISAFKNFSTLAISSVVGILSYYVFIVAQKPRIDTSNGKMRKFLDCHVPTIKEKFWPNILFFDGRLQTILGMRLRKALKSKVPYQREVLTMADGGQIGLDYLHPEESIPPEGDRLIVFFLPGLTSHSQTTYVQTIALSVVKSGCTVVVLNNRGMGGVDLKTPRMYSASSFTDMREVIMHLKKKYPNDKLIAIGASLGGMVLSTYITTNPEEAKENLECALLMSICWEANKGVKNLESGFVNKYILNYGLTQGLTHLAKKYKKVFEGVVGVGEAENYEKVIKSKTLREFDSFFTAPHFGFKSVECYYKSASAAGNTHKYSIPVFAFGAADDPFQPNDYIPYDESNAKNSKLALITTKRGGHIGFVENSVKIDHYMERFVRDFVLAVRLHHLDELQS